MASTKGVIDHHLKYFGEGDLEGILADYAPGCRPVHAGRTAQGSHSIACQWSAFPGRNSELHAIDANAVRVRGKLAYPTGSSIDKTDIADEKHTISLEAFAPVDVDESVIQEIIKIEESVKFDKGG